MWRSNVTSPPAIGMNDYHKRLGQLARLRIVPFIGAMIVVWSFVSCQRAIEPLINEKDASWPEAIAKGFSVRHYGWPFISRVRSPERSWHSHSAGLAINTSLLLLASGGTFLFLQRIRHRNSFAITMRHMFAILTVIPLMVISAFPSTSFENFLSERGLVRTQTFAGEEAYNFFLGYSVFLLLLVHSTSTLIFKALAHSSQNGTTEFTDSPAGPAERSATRP